MRTDVTQTRSQGFITKAVARVSGARCEDRVEAIESDEALVIALADGAAGVGNAAEAADFVVTSVMDIAVGRSWLAMSKEFWCDVLRDIDRSLSRSSYGGESTAVVVSITAR